MANTQNGEGTPDRAKQPLPQTQYRSPIDFCKQIHAQVCDYVLYWYIYRGPALHTPQHSGLDAGNKEGKGGNQDQNGRKNKPMKGKGYGDVVLLPPHGGEDGGESPPKGGNSASGSPGTGLEALGDLVTAPKPPSEAYRDAEAAVIPFQMEIEDEEYGFGLTGPASQALPPPPPTQKPVEKSNRKAKPKGGGRDLGVEVGNPILGMDELVRAPKPPVFRFHAGASKEEHKPGAFWEYARSLPDEVKRRVMVYVYRNLPALNLPKGERAVAIITGEEIGAVEGNEFSESSVLSRLGSGDYYLMLNDQGVKTGGKNTLCVCLLSLRDMENHPPIIEDITKVVWHDPANRWYVDWLVRSNIAVPGTGIPALEMVWQRHQNKLEEQTHDEDERQELDDMAEVKATNTLADMLQSTQATLIEMVKEKGRENQRPVAVPVATPPAPPNPQQQVDALKQMGDMVVGMAEKLAKSAGESSPQANPNSGVGVMEVVNLAKELAGLNRGDGGGQIELLREELAHARKEHTEMMKLLFSKTEAQPQTQAQPQAAAAPKTLVEQLAELNTVRELVAGFGGGGGGEDAVEKVARVATSSNPWVEVAKSLAPAVLPILGNLMQLLSQQGQPQGQGQGQGMQPQYPQQYPQQYPPQYAPPQIPQPTNPNPMGMPNPNLNPNSVGMPQIVNPNTGELLTPEEQEMQFAIKHVINSYMPVLGPAIIRATMDDMPGWEFARQFKSMYGDAAYAQVVQLGGDVVLEVIKAAPSTAAAFSAKPDIFARFVGEFLNPEVAEAADAAANGGEDEGEDDGEDDNEVGVVPTGGRRLN